MSIIVTGASGALGQEVCKVLAENGIEVAPVRGVDLTDADAAQEAISEIANNNSPIQGLVNVAGGFAWETVMDGDVSTWHDVRTDARPAALCHLPLKRLTYPGSHHKDFHAIWSHPFSPG